MKPLNEKLRTKIETVEFDFLRRCLQVAREAE
jgi:hypothetical protein